MLCPEGLHVISVETKKGHVGTGNQQALISLRKQKLQLFFLFKSFPFLSFFFLSSQPPDFEHLMANFGFLSTNRKVSGLLMHAAS